MVDNGGLCGACWRETPFILGPACHACGIPVLVADEPEIICDTCRDTPRPWDLGRAVMLYEGGARRLVLSFKHSDRLDLGPVLGGWMAERAHDLVDETTIVAPVPLHWRRLFARRYNQAAILSGEVARRLGLPHLPDLLQRVRATAPQDGIGPAARRDNIAGAIGVTARHAPTLSGRSVLLVDDVMTSGATLEAAARACRAAGAERICVLVLARVSRDL